MQRDATDTSAGVSILGSEIDEPNKKKAKGSMEQKHKTLVSKLNGQCGKLAKSISSAESCLPSLRRKLPSHAFESFKKGVEMCREARENIWDEIEDLKALAPDEASQEEQVEKLKCLLQKASEHLDALAEVKRQYEPEPPPAIKNEGGEEAQGEAGDTPPGEGAEGTS